ncbi:pentatricopeptide repeat-containing protein At2g03380, mitochondrial [Gastrolobium bilobum]|uniref:pentatricopeptide repeat-containing protein At2g03380, mitochondrial n=1 Tax=Gastrolobium bilobum TaxID=150636 RepID=UPI002AB1A9FB|nr:pentatricopeptide repeat-containing protein At2g03380, mitochondrial [Gastrolobium bilobum]
MLVVSRFLRHAPNVGFQRRFFNDNHAPPLPPTFYLARMCRNVDTVKKLHASLLVHGVTGDLLSDTKLVSLYASFGNLRHARNLFDRLPSPDFYSFKVMIRWYFLNDMHSHVVSFFHLMRVTLGLCNDDVVFSIVLKACCELRDVVHGAILHCHIIKAKPPDSFVMTALVDVYSKCGRVQSARQVFDEIADRNVVSWTSMIVAYVQNDCAHEGLTLFNRMREGFVDGNQFTVGSLVTACTKLGSLHQGKWVHGYIIKNGIELNSFLATSLLNMYVKCGDIRDARSVFDEFSIDDDDLVSWTAMIVGYTQRGYPLMALELFINNKWVGLLPNSVTLASLLSASAQLGNTVMGKSLHALLVKCGLDDPPVRNALVDMYAKCHLISDARYVFETSVEKDVISWNSIISGYAHSGSAYEALELFQRMRSDSFSPDAVTVVGVLSACASIGALQLGASLHAFSLKDGLVSSSIYVGTALLNFYAKCGDAKSARMVFDGMGEKNTVTWSAMIGGYGMQGDGSGSLALFKDMLKEEFEPNDVVFTTILAACSHSGMVGEGSRLFDLMCRELNFVPSMKHYACMVDLLARAGNLEEALDFIDKMPVQPSVSVFGAFLHGCGLHSRFELGEVAIRRMLELHPDEACYYVLVSNLYASDGRWGLVKQVREMIKLRGLNKVPGCSLVKMDINNDRYARVAVLP